MTSNGGGGDRRPGCGFAPGRQPADYVETLSAAIDLQQVG